MNTDWARLEQYRKTLTSFFIRGGCHVPEELVDKTFDRVIKKLQSGAILPSVDLGAYCYGVARNVLHEYRREPKPDPLPDDPVYIAPEPAWSEHEFECLQTCLDRLGEHDRILIQRFHQFEGRKKIETRKEMAGHEGGMNALRIKACRIRKKLRDCISDCLEESETALTQ
jgi:hypothetical protein